VPEEVTDGLNHDGEEYMKFDVRKVKEGAGFHILWFNTPEDVFYAPCYYAELTCQLKRWGLGLIVETTRLYKSWEFEVRFQLGPIFLLVQLIGAAADIPDEEEQGA
jgi:hypothetical protein